MQTARAGRQSHHKDRQTCRGCPGRSESSATPDLTSSRFVPGSSPPDTAPGRRRRALRVRVLGSGGADHDGGRRETGGASGGTRLGPATGRERCGSRFRSVPRHCRRGRRPRVPVAVVRPRHRLVHVVRDRIPGRDRRPAYHVGASAAGHGPCPRHDHFRSPPRRGAAGPRVSTNGRRRQGTVPGHGGGRGRDRVPGGRAARSCGLCPGLRLRAADVPRPTIGTGDRGYLPTPRGPAHGLADLNGRRKPTPIIVVTLYAETD